MPKQDLKQQLEELVDHYNRPGFIEDDPISIPHQFTRKQDIEIMGFWVAMLAWGQRKTIINKAQELVALMDDNTISSRAGKDVFEAMLATGDAPAKIVEEKGLTQISDPAKLAEIIDGVIQANAAQAEQYRAGKTQLLGFFVGQVMKASRGKADPQATREVLLEKL